MSMSISPIVAMHRLHRFITAAPLLGALLLSSNLRAEVPDPARARQLFEDGKAAAARQDWNGAFELFQQSWDASPSYDTAANLGQTALKVGKPEVAARFLSYSLRHFPPSGDKAKRDAVAAFLAKASSEVAKISLTVEPADAAVAVDGMRVGTVASLEGELFVAPGSHTVEANSAGYATERQSIAAEKGVPLSVALRLRRETITTPATPNESSAMPSAPSSADAPPPAEKPRGPDRTAPGSASAGIEPDDAGRWLGPAVLGGVTIVGGIATFVLRSNASSDNDEYRRLQTTLSPGECTGATPSSACQSLRDTADRQHSEATWSDVTLAATCVAGAAAIGWLTYDLVSSPSSTAVRAGVGFGNRGAAVFLNGNF